MVNKSFGFQHHAQTLIYRDIWDLQILSYLGYKVSIAFLVFFFFSFLGCIISCYLFIHFLAFIFCTNVYEC